MSKTILVITDNLPDQINGVVTTFRNIEEPARQDGYHIQYIDASCFLNWPCPGYPEVRLSWPRHMGTRILAAWPNHVHIATEGPLGLAARLWLDDRGWRYNTSYHTRFPEFLHKIYHIPPALTYAYVRWFHKHSGRVLTTTTTMVDMLQRHGFRGDIQAWTRGVDRDALRPSRDWPHEHDYASRTQVVSVGRISREKNLRDLLDLSDEFDISVVGDGPERERLESEYPRVRFLGYRRGSALADAYAQADVFAFPSQTDTFGIVMIEAMSVGTPVAAYPVPGPQDVIEPGVTGYMDWDLARAIRRCTGLRRSTVQQASQRWTWQQCWEIFRQNLVPVTDVTKRS
jgi:glycosyltransferase involved in cell wall biosynthesis